MASQLSPEDEEWMGPFSAFLWLFMQPLEVFFLDLFHITVWNTECSGTADALRDKNMPLKDEQTLNCLITCTAIKK